jgi:hypothetical protein
MKTADQILESTDFPNYSEEAIADGWAWQCMIAAMQEYADQQTAALTANIQKLVDEVVKYRMERDEYRKALQALADSCINVKYNITKKPLLKFVNQAFSTLNRHPQQ